MLWKYKYNSSLIIIKQFPLPELVWNELRCLSPAVPFLHNLLLHGFGKTSVALHKQREREWYWIHGPLIWSCRWSSCGHWSTPQFKSTPMGEILLVDCNDNLYILYGHWYHNSRYMPWLLSPLAHRSSLVKSVNAQSQTVHGETTIQLNRYFWLYDIFEINYIAIKRAIKNIIILN